MLLNIIFLVYTRVSNQEEKWIPTGRNGCLEGPRNDGEEREDKRSLIETERSFRLGFSYIYSWLRAELS